MFAPTEFETARHMAGVYGKQEVRRAFRPWFPRCGCGRFLGVDGGCGRCDR